MKKITTFDVLVVYTHNNATSAGSPEALTPFKPYSRRAHYNDAYAYFLETCAKNNLRAALTTTKDLIPGKIFSSYWIYRRGSWSKVNQKCRTKLIFDKFSSRRDYLFLNSQIKSFTSPALYNIFSDKQRTYDELAEFTIPTVSLEGHSMTDIENGIFELKILTVLHPTPQDFSGMIILKDRFGAGGNKIYKIGNFRQKSKIFEILKSHPKSSFIIQPFTKFEKGFKYKNYSGFIDIRLIYIKNKVVQAYIRVAKQNDFRCNEHKGGSLVYIPLKDIPKLALNFSGQILDVLDTKGALFALDFVISNSGNVYLMEGNNGPGVDWNLALKKNERMAKKLIRLIVAELTVRSHTDHNFLNLQNTL